MAGRRNEHSRAQLQGMAIEAAGAIVDEEGLRGLTVRKVAGRIGYAAGSLYVLFENLDDLVVHLNGATLERMRAALAEAVQHADPHPALHAMAFAYLAFAEAHANRWRAVFEHRVTRVVERPAAHMRTIEGMFALVRAPLARVCSEASPEQLDLATTALWSSVHGVCVLGLDEQLDIGGVTDTRAVLRATVDTFLKGLDQTPAVG